MNSNRVFCRLDRARPDDLPGRLGLEGHRLAGEWIGALPRLGGRLLDHHELGKAGNQEHTGFLQLLVTHRRKRLQNALDLLLRNFSLRRDLLDQLRLRHLYGHFVSYRLIRLTDSIWESSPETTQCHDSHSFVDGLDAWAV